MGTWMRWGLLGAGAALMGVFAASGCGNGEPAAGGTSGESAPAAPVAMASAAEMETLPTTYAGLPLLGIPRVAVDPGAVQGDLSEPAWQQAATRTLLSSATSEVLPYATEVKLFCTDQALYVGFRCAEPALDKLVTTGDFWAHDEVELFLEPADSLVKRPYFQVMTDVTGAHETDRYHVYPNWFNQRYGVSQWGAAVTSAAKVGTDGWTAAVRIPWDQLTLDASAQAKNTLWRMNLYRSRPGRGTDPWMAWSWSPPMVGSFHTPAKFGYVLPAVFASASLVTRVRAEAGPQLENRGVPPFDAARAKNIDDKIQAVLGSTAESREQAVADLRAIANADLADATVMVPHLQAAIKAYGEGNTARRAAQAVLAEVSAAVAKHQPDDPAPLEVTETVDRFVPSIFKDDKEGVLPYRLRKPYDFDTAAKYPLYIYLHGSGESGDDNRSQLSSAGFFMSRAEFRRKFPCFVLLPQCPRGQAWANTRATQESIDQGKLTSNFRFAAEPTMPMRCLLELIPQLLKDNPAIDAKRIYITGGSLGGLGTWDAIMRQPTWFAAASPSAGAGDETHVQDIVNLPIWIFHGEVDMNVKTAGARNMRDALEKAGGHPKYTEYKGIGHPMSDKMYEDSTFLDWLFAQHRE